MLPTSMTVSNHSMPSLHSTQSFRHVVLESRKMHFTGRTSFTCLFDDSSSSHMWPGHINLIRGRMTMSGLNDTATCVGDERERRREMSTLLRRTDSCDVSSFLIHPLFLSISPYGQYASFMLSAWQL